MRARVKNYLLMTNYSSFDASEEEKYDASKMNVVALLSQTLLHIFFAKKRLFLEHLLSKSQTGDLRSNMMAY